MPASQKGFCYLKGFIPFLNQLTDEEKNFDWRAFLQSKNERRGAIEFKEKKQEVRISVFLYIK